MTIAELKQAAEDRVNASPKLLMYKGLLLNDWGAVPGFRRFDAQAYYSGILERSEEETLNWCRQFYRAQGEKP